MTSGITTQPIEFDALVRECQQPVTRYLLARTGSQAEAAELTQETFVRAYCALSKGDQPRHPLGWLLRIARNVFVDAVRGQRSQRRLAEHLGHIMGMGWPSLWLEHTERRIIVGNAVDNLPEDLREPVLLHYFGGLSTQEVAHHLNISAGAVKTRLWRARQSLRGELEALMSDAKKKVLFQLPEDLVTRAKQIAEKPPLHDGISVNLQVGGTHYPTDPLADPLDCSAGLSLDNLQFAVSKMHAVRIAGNCPLTDKFSFVPVLELFEHPRCVEIWSYTRTAGMGAEDYDASEEAYLWPTDGWRLGTDPDAPKLLRDFHAAGLQHAWFTFAGLEDTHDELVRRPGAYAAIITAMQRCRDAGINVGANIIVSTRNTHQIAAIAERILTISDGGPGSFIPLYPLASSRHCLRYEEIRPTPEDLVNVPPVGMDVTWGCKEVWQNPEAFTEGALTRAVLEGKETPEPEKRFIWNYRGLGLWVTPELDLFRENHNYLPRQRIANLRDDSPEVVNERIAGLEPAPQPPSDAELARRYGDPTSRKVHPNNGGRNYARDKWLKLWLEEQEAKNEDAPRAG